MAALEERVKLSKLVNGKDIVDFYQKNTNFMYFKYLESNEECKSIDKSDIRTGGFYFLHYLDDSNWMRWSPIFCCDWRKFNNMIVILGVNFNFIPLELRSRIFDKFIREEDFEKNSFLEVNFRGMYSELIKIGFEYAIQEYNVAQIKAVHRISLDLLPRFLFSSHPKNTYDPNKLMEIWQTKLETKEDRHKEMVTSILEDFYDINKDISDSYKELGDHIKRVRSSYEKYGKP
jgi:hypothetical protein